MHLDGTIGVNNRREIVPIQKNICALGAILYEKAFRPDLK
jgi:hypothetical protein